MSKIYTSIAPSKGAGIRIWKKLGPKTEKLIQDNIDVTLRDDLEVLVMDENLKKPLKVSGLLTRDSRMKESKKYGLKRARKAAQYTKR